MHSLTWSNQFKSFHLIIAAHCLSPMLLCQLYITLQKSVWICTGQLRTNHELLWLSLARNSAVWPVSCRSSHVHLLHQQHHCSNRGAQRWETESNMLETYFKKLFNKCFYCFSTSGELPRLWAGKGVFFKRHTGVVLSEWLWWVSRFLQLWTSRCAYSCFELSDQSPLLCKYHSDTVLICSSQ